MMISTKYICSEEIGNIGFVKNVEQVNISKKELRFSFFES